MDEIDRELALIEPCPVLISADNDGTHVATVDPQMMAMAFPDAEIGDLPQQISAEAREIIDKAT